MDNRFSTVNLVPPPPKVFLIWNEIFEAEIVLGGQAFQRKEKKATLNISLNEI